MLPIHRTPLCVALALAFSFLSTTAYPQQPRPESAKLEQVPLGPGPLLQHAPEFASWRILFTYPPTKGQGASEKSPFRRMVSLAVTKTKQIQCEEAMFNDGSKSESWQVGDLLLQSDPSGRLCIYAPESLANRSSADPTDPNAGPKEVHSENGKCDFIGFDWVSKSNYRGAQTIHDKDYFVFQGKIGADFLGFFVIGMPATAWIDQETRLPFVLRTAEWTMTYEFGPPPTALLVLPERVQKLLEERARVIKALTTRNPSY